MRSLRLDSELEQRLVRAASLRGESVSEFIRVAASERADATLTPSDDGNFDDVIAIIHSNGGQARRTGAAFAEALAERRCGR